MFFETLGPFDESLLNTKEHLDFCMNVMALGRTVYFEPDSRSDLRSGANSGLARPAFLYVALES